MDNKFQSLLMESWSPQQGVSSDFVVCGGSPEMELEAQGNFFSFNPKNEDHGHAQYMLSERGLEAGTQPDCLTLNPREQQDQSLRQVRCEEMKLEAEKNCFSFNCKETEEDLSLTVAMFPEVHSPLAAEGWSEIPLKTPIKKEEEQQEEVHIHTPPPPQSGFDDKTLNIPVPASSGCNYNGCQTGIDMDFESSEDPTLCNSLIKLVTGHRDMEIFKENAIMCINAGEQLMGIDFQKDLYFVGGDVIRTEEILVEKEVPSIYQTARFGDFSYVIGDLPAGDYFVDLHFAEIIFTNGPPRMRVFDVFIQEEKILSELDIYARVGANMPLVLMDAPANVIDGGKLTIRFEAIIGSPIVSAICIRKTTHFGAKMIQSHTFREEDSRKTDQVHELIVGEEDCNPKCRGRNCKSALEYKRKFEALSKDFELKKSECHEAWMSLEDTNRQLENLRNELMRKSMHVGSLAYAVEGQVNELRDLQDKHGREKKVWVSQVHLLNEKFKMLKSECAKVSEEANSYASSFADISRMTSAVQALVDQHEELKVQFIELKAKFIEECKERKQLYNKLLELKGNIRVFCRCRPLSAEEVAEGAVSIADFEAAKDGELSIRANGAPKKVFKFDSVFTPQDNQVDVFAHTAPVVVSVLDGYNVCIFAYGQTGTGKTFTMEGTEENRGVNYKTLEELFRVSNERKGQFTYDISVSVLEVYNEHIRDLLAAPPQPGQTIKKLEIKQVAEGVHHVPGLVEAQVHSMSEVWEVLQTGSSARAVGSTNANEHSSRSHCILCVMVRGDNLINGECTRSKLWLVDLAGSERVAKTDVQGERLKEAQNINKSLSALGDVISALATKNSHIPFRNSKLTHLLQDSLGGDSKTLMFVQISPAENDISETLCSLNFASRVRGIELGPARKQIDSTELLKYKQMVEKAKHEVKSKDGLVKKMEESIQILEAKLKGRDQTNKSLQDKVKELEGQLVNERKARLTPEIRVKEQQAEKIYEKPPLMRSRTVNDASLLSRDLVNLSDPLTENRHRYNTLDCNGGKPQDIEIPFPLRNCVIDPYSKEQKENNVELCDQIQKPMLRRTGRASICTTARRTTMVPPARRVSMIPLPVTTRNDCVLATMTTSKINEDEEANSRECSAANRNPIMLPNSTQDSVMLPTSTPVSLRGLRTSNTLNRLRRSIHKKVQFNSPLLVRGQSNDPAAAGERAKLPPLDTNRIRRISSVKTWGRISGTGNISAQRVLCSNRSGTKPSMQLKEKERGWNR